MAGAFIEISSLGQKQINQAIEALIERGQNLEPAFAEMGELLLESTRLRVDNEESADGLSFAPLKPETIERKGHARILRDSNTFYDLLNYQVTPTQLTLGTGQEYMASHVFGRESANIPERNPFGLSSEDTQDIFDVLAHHFDII